jgi:uncharacterized protein
MNKEKITQDTIAFVKERLGKEGTGHDWWHIERVRKNAKLINKTEKADWFVIDLAVLLHDIGDRKVINTENDDYSIAENFLRSCDVLPDKIEQIMFIIRNMSFSQSLDKMRLNASKEFCVVQDADRLDALGAIGIARAFAFGGARSRLLYDPTKKVRRIDTTENYKKRASSTFIHFYEKILLLKDLMNTKSAKKIAQKRHEYIEKYMKQFLLEWKGKR